MGFEELLSTKVEDATRPPPIPAGNWTLLCKGYERIDSGKKKTPGYEITFGLVAPGADVNQDALDEYAASGHEWAKKELSYTFWLTADALYRLREFLEHTGVDITGKTFKQVMTDVPGESVIGEISHVPSQKKGDDSVYANIVAFTAAA